MKLLKLNTTQVIGGLALLAFAFRSTFKPIVIDPNVTKRYFNRLLVNVLAFKLDRANNLILALRIDNPNPTVINLQSIVGQVYFKGRLLGDIAYYNRQSIPALTFSNIMLAVRIKDASVLAYIAQFLTSGLKNEPINFVGNISVNGQVLAVQETFNLKR